MQIISIFLNPSKQLSGDITLKAVSLKIKKTRSVLWVPWYLFFLLITMETFINKNKCNYNLSFSLITGTLSNEITRFPLWRNMGILLLILQTILMAHAILRPKMSGLCIIISISRQMFENPLQQLSEDAVSTRKLYL